MGYVKIVLTQLPDSVFLHSHPPSIGSTVEAPHPRALWGSLRSLFKKHDVNSF
jgi:hypothetical protein